MAYDSSAGGGRSNWLWWALGALLVIVAVWAIWAAMDDSAGPETGASVEEVSGEAAGFTGASVTLSGNVTETFAEPFAFRLAGDVPVMLEQGLQAPELEEGELIRVTGEIRAFEPDVFEEEFGVDTGAAFFDGIEEGDAVLIASSIQENVQVNEDDGLIETGEGAGITDEETGDDELDTAEESGVGE